jgi:hypothetical protein
MKRRFSRQLSFQSENGKISMERKTAAKRDYFKEKVLPVALLFTRTKR